MRNTLFFEEDDRFWALLDRAASGDEIVITRQGKPIARVAPLSVVSDADRDRALAALEEMDRHAKEMNLGPFHWDEWKSYRDEGRR